jgi:hypothetical protein
MTVLAFTAGIGVQPLARRVEARRGGAPILAGLAATAAGAAVGAVAVATTNRILAGAAALLLGLGYGLCLVSGLRQAEHLAGARDRGAVVACYYVLAYLGFAVPYAVTGLNAALGETGALAALAAGAAALLAWTSARRPVTPPATSGLRRAGPPSFPSTLGYRSRPRPARSPRS